jgi:hypothetical protein
LFERSNVAKSTPEQVVELGLLFVVPCLFCGCFSFRHDSTHFTDMARLK